MAYDERLADRIRDVLVGEPGVVEKRMFGGLGFLVGGHLAVSASSKGGLLLRVEPAATEEALARPHASPFVMRGREMSGWVWVAAEGVGSEEELEGWVRSGVAYARSLPPK